MARERCRHNNILCEQPGCMQPSDAAKRFCDGVNGLLAFNKPWEIQHKWLAVKLEDGSVDSSLYDTRPDAISHQERPDLHFYFPVGNFASGMTPIMAEICLMAQRDAYDSGLRITDGHDQDQFLSTERGDIYRDLIFKNLRIPGISA